MWNIRGFSTTKYVSLDPIWKMTHIVNIVDTWEHDSNTIEEIQGYALVKSTWNHNIQCVGRDYDSITTFIKSQFLSIIHLDHQNIEV